MADPRFHSREGPFRLSELAALAGAELDPQSDPDHVIVDVAPLGAEGRDLIGFLDNRKYLPVLADSKLGACVLDPALAGRAPEGMALLLAAAPYRAYALIARAFYPDRHASGQISPSAHIEPGAEIGAQVEIGPGAVIEAGARIGAGTRIGPGAVIGCNCEIGRNCRIDAGASVICALIGDRVHLYPGVRIGQEGFGFAMDPAGHVRVPQLGRVIIEEDVEIGANATVDRGAGPDTIIRAGAMIDNLVQIGHNAEIGRGAVIVAQAGVAGSTRLGEEAVMAAQSGVAGHLTIGRGARIAAQAGIIRDVPDGAEMAGMPGVPSRDFFRREVLMRRMTAARRGARRDDTPEQEDQGA